MACQSVSGLFSATLCPFRIAYGGATRCTRALCAKSLSRAGSGTSVLLEDLLVSLRPRRHGAVHAHVDQPAPGCRRVAVLVREPVLPRVALAVRAGDVVARGHLQRGAARRIRDRHLERDDAWAWRGVGQKPACRAFGAGREVDLRREVVEAVDGGLL